MGGGSQVPVLQVRVLSVLTQELATILEMIENWMKKHDESKSLSGIKEYIKNNEGNLCESEIFRQLNYPMQAALKELNVPYAIFEDADSDKLKIYFRECDRETVRGLYKNLTDPEKGLIDEKSLGNYAVFKHSFEGLSAAEKDSFVLAAKAQHIFVATTKCADNSYRVSFPAVSQPVLNAIYEDVFFSTHGHGAITKNPYSTERMNEIKRSIDSGEKMNIVSPTNSAVFISVNKSGYTVYRNHEPIERVSRRNSDFDNKIFAAIQKHLTVPLVLTDEQMFSLSNEEKMELASPSKGNSEQEKKFAEIEQNVKNLIHLKMSIENDPASEVHLDFLNPNVSFGQFLHLESINEHNNAEISANEASLMGIKEYYDSLTVDEQQYFYQFLSEYHSYVAYLDNVKEVEEIDISTMEPTLDDVIKDAQSQAQTGEYDEDYNSPNRYGDYDIYDGIIDNPNDDMLG